MWPDRRVIDLFGIEHPLILAPMTGVGTVNLAASVCAAGGLGSVSCATLPPERAAQTIKQLREMTDRPINVNFFCLSEPKAILNANRHGANAYLGITASSGSTPNCSGRSSISRHSAPKCAVSSRPPSPKW